MKYFWWAILVTFSLHLFAQTGTSTESDPEQAAESAPPSDDSIIDTLPNQRSLPDITADRIQSLKQQYPAEDIRELSAEGGTFTALWREDRSGKANGAVLLVPTDGQTANWPQTVDVLRTDLPKHGWSTLAIDIAFTSPPKAPPRPTRANVTQEAENGQTSPDSTEDTEPAETSDAPRDDSRISPLSPKQIEQQNRSRIEAGIQFLNAQGQYNIIFVGYGQSAERVTKFASEGEGAGLQANGRTLPATGMQRPARALIIINPKTTDNQAFKSLIKDIPYKKMPILDIVVGKHYLDMLDAEQREITALEEGFETYLQYLTVEPNTTVFNTENRLSRRILGFLNQYAKGVEIERR